MDPYLQSGTIDNNNSSTHLTTTKQPPKSKLKGSKTNTKTIKAPGSRLERVAQACDRCRAKKTKCDGKNPCSTCSAVGLECIVSDKLSRKAFPKGYTETLEERVRQLEAENKKLVGLLDMRDEQLEILNSGINITNNNKSDGELNQSIISTNDSDEFHKITASNLSLLDRQNDIHSHDHQENGCLCCSNASPHAVHDRPVSIAGSVYGFDNHTIPRPGSINLDDGILDDDTESLLSPDEYSMLENDTTFVRKGGRHHHYASNSTNRESTPAPGAFAAATAIAQMQKNKIFQHAQPQHQKQENLANKQQLLTSLVAMSIPRSTEETLCIPTLLARVCQAYGYDSKPAVLAANALGSLKETSIEVLRSPLPEDRQESLNKIIMNRSGVQKLNESEATIFLRELIELPQSRLDMDQLITVYFQEWANALPIIDKNGFLKNYLKLTNILEQHEQQQRMENESDESVDESNYESIEKFGAIMVLILALALVTKKNTYLNESKSDMIERYANVVKHYDYLIHEFIKPNCLVTQYCSIQSLQILSLALQYCLVTGDITTCYELRGRVISMAQQLRLHRCPAAVLGISGSNDGDVLRNYMQAERRILFWCVYCLDVYASLGLGIPRLLKDYEIECAMPFAGKSDDDDDDDDNVNILIVNNTELSIVGKVTKFALSIMLYCKVLANILDSIYSRFENNDIQRHSLSRDRMLDCWRRELPVDLKFEIDINGLTLKDVNNNYIDGNLWQNYNKQQITLIFLYYHAKILIYLPIISKYGHHHNVGLSEKEKLAKGDADTATIVSSISLIQQSCLQILEVLKCLSSNLSSTALPIPTNITREQSLFALFVAKGTLDYIKGGPLFNNSKQLLLDTINSLSQESRLNTPGGLNRNSFKLLELAILSILGLKLSKPTSNIRKKVLTSQPITRTAVERDPGFPRTLFRNNSTTPPPTPAMRLKSPTSNFDITNDEMFNILEKASPPTVMTNSQPAQDTFVTANASAEMGDIPMSNDTLSIDDSDGLESLLKFDPFKISINRQVLMNEFVADGSLGLVPFLEMHDSTGNTTNEDMFSMYNSNNDASQSGAGARGVSQEYWDI
ncbi:CAT8 [[Candida] subhashii]|uniref:CAT8 n=1 Tax=[Candida] subhashii TaxID=561895 RepID=A0A8J5QJC4_9ASCO|nr:CAT8 [[Candida] subhashii]KAG7662010.1 CAT8 [[Candida] subhashii]